MEISHICALLEHSGPCIKAFPKGGGEPLMIELAPVHVLLAYIAWSEYDLRERRANPVTRAKLLAHLHRLNKSRRGVTRALS